MEASAGSSKYELKFDGEGVEINGQRAAYDILPLGNNRFSVIRDHEVYEVVIKQAKGKSYTVLVNGTEQEVILKDSLDKMLASMGIDQVAQSGDNEVKAPMPGLILNIMVEAGQEVKKGDSLLILEAMKMENVIKSPVDGVVAEVLVSVNDSVEKNRVLCCFS